MCEPVKESWDSFCPLDELQAVHIAVSAAHDHESTKPKCNAKRSDAMILSPKFTV